MSASLGVKVGSGDGCVYNIPDNNLFQRIVKDFIDQRFSTKFKMWGEKILSDVYQ